MGLIVGSLGTGLTLGIIDESPLDTGSGLGSLLNASKQNGADTGQSAGSPTAADGESDLPFKFEFQELLLEEEYVLSPPQRPERTEPQKETTEPASSATQPAATTTAAPVPRDDGKSNYVVQVGSFRKFDDADQTKATLALSGLQAFIQKVTVEGRGEFYRVRIGPFDQYGAAEQATNRLTQLNYQPLIFRVRTSG